MDLKKAGEIRILQFHELEKSEEKPMMYLQRKEKAGENKFLK